MSTKSRFLEPLAINSASGISIKAAAAIVGCSEQTAYNISATLDFRQRVSAIRSAMTDQAVGELAAGAAEAVTTLRELLKPENEPSIRLQAGKALLTLMGPFSEANELRHRLEAIEQSQNSDLKVAS